MLDEVERLLVAESARRANLLVQLRRHEEDRRYVLKAMERYSKTTVLRCLHDGLELAAAVGQIDERIQSLCRQRARLGTEQALLRDVSRDLADLPRNGEIEIDGRACRFAQATRHMYRLVGERHEEAAGALLDGPLQKLSGAVLEAELALHNVNGDEETARAAAFRCHRATAEAVIEVEQLSGRWQPIRAERDLASAIRVLVSETALRQPALIRVVGLERRLSTTTELAAYRIVEEAVANAAQHAPRSRVEVVLSYHPDRLKVLVKDDGDGFDLLAAEARLGRSNAMGLISMREHAELAGGRFDVRSTVGVGTEVRATFRLG